MFSVRPVERVPRVGSAVGLHFRTNSRDIGESVEFASKHYLGDQLGSTVNGSQGFPTLGPNQNFPQGRKESLYQFQDTVGLTKGRQSFRMGTDIGRQLETDLVSQNALGTVNIAPGGVDAAGNATGNSALGNFILNQTGPSGSVTKTFGKTRVDPHGFRNGFFLQDDIKFSADLTLNFGVRYDFLTDPENSLQYPGIDIKNPFAPINTVVKVKGDYNNISPRLGFAYSPHGYFGFLGDAKPCYAADSGSSMTAPSQTSWLIPTRAP